MNKASKILLILIIIVIIIILLLLFIINLYNKESTDNGNIQVMEENIIAEDMEKPKEVTNPHMYMTVKSCIEKYINYIYMDDNVSVYRIIDNEYINKFNITENNVLENVENISTPFTLEINKMYFVQENENEQEYYVSAVINEEDVEGMITGKKEFTVTVKLDINNMIYSIIPNGYGGPLYEEK